MDSSRRTFIGTLPPYWVVVIEPRHDVRFVLKRLLEREGQHHHVSDGREVVERSSVLTPDTVSIALGIARIRWFRELFEDRHRHEIARGRL